MMYNLESFTSRGWHQSDAEVLQRYAITLAQRGLPVIFDEEHAALWLRTKLEYLYGVANSPAGYYRRFNVAKKSGGLRTINEPLPTLKSAQKWILNNILAKIDVHKSAHAYEQGRSVKKMMLVHKAKRYSVRLDLSNCFDNIRIDQVYNVFVNAGYFSHVSALLASVCFCESGIAQGAPTSGSILNRIMRACDDDIFEYCAVRKVYYSRYADDLIFSSNSLIDVESLVQYVSSVLRSTGQKINKSKTRVMGRSIMGQACGIVYGNKNLTVNKRVRREIRKSIYYLEKNGILFEADRVGGDPVYYLNNLDGRVNWCMHIMGKKEEFLKWKRIISEERRVFEN